MQAAEMPSGKLMAWQAGQVMHNPSRSLAANAAFGLRNVTTLRHGFWQHQGLRRRLCTVYSTALFD
jgi:hypothetical protein